MKPQDLTNEQLAAELLEPLPHAWAVKEAARRLQNKESDTTPRKGWGIRISPVVGAPFLRSDFFWTRSEAIERYNSFFFKPNQYQFGRRAGLVKAVRVTLAEDTQLKEPNKCK